MVEKEQYTLIPKEDRAVEAKSPQYLAQVQQVSKEIDFSNANITFSYGAKTMGEISQFADGLLGQIKAKDAGYVGEQLTELMIKVKGVDVRAFEQKESFIARIPIIGSLFKKVEHTLAEYQTLTQQVDAVAKQLDRAMVHLLRDIEVLEQLYERNKEFYRDISIYIDAGRQKLIEVKDVDLPALKQRAELTGDMMDAQAVKDLMDKINRFERRLHDMELSKTISYQTAPQIRLIQTNNHTLTEKIQSSILSTIPIWKSQMVLAVTIYAQRNAANLQKEIADTTNDLLKKNAEMLETSSIETARAVERSIIDIETIRDVQNRLVHTIEETVNIAKEARTRRGEVEKELSTIEKDLKDRLSAIADKS